MTAGDFRACVQMAYVLRFDFCGQKVEPWRRLRRVLATLYRQDEENAQVGLCLVIEPGPLQDVLSRYLRKTLGASCHLDFMAPAHDDSKLDLCYRNGLWSWRFKYKKSSWLSGDTLSNLERECRRSGPKTLARFLASVDLSDFDPTYPADLIG